MSQEVAPLSEIETFTAREHIVRLLPNGAVGIELGVAEGYFSSTLLSTGRFSHLYSVDMWAGDRGHDVNQYKKALRALWHYKDKSTCLKMRFDEALDLFEDESLDFIYIDGYAHTGQENGKTLEAWWRKIKKGGIFAGDDYDTKWPLVQSEVDAFAARRDLELHILRPDAVVNKWSASPSWATRKPIPSSERSEKLSAIAQQAEASCGWRDAFVARNEARTHSENRETAGKRRRSGIKYSEEIRVSGDRPAAKEIVKDLVREVVNHFPTKGLASSLSVPASFDSFGALLIAHKVGAGWLPRYGAKSDDVDTLFRVAEVGDVDINDRDAEELVKGVAPNLSKAPFGFWMILHSLLFRRCLVSASYAAKYEAAKRVVSTDRSLPKESRAAAAAYLNGTSIDPPSSPCQQYLDLISGKSVAIVGPGVNKLGSGQEIDEFDLVARTNPIELEVLRRQASSSGSRTDIAYYNGRMLQHRRDDAYKAMGVAEGLKFACFRSEDDANEGKAILGESSVRTSSLPSTIFMGRGFALRHYVSDILNFAPSRIKLFGADFFLGKETHYEGYLDTKLNLAHSFVVHDVRESWRYLRSLFAEGKVEADEVLAEILSLDERDFFQRITDRLASLNTKEVKVSRG